MPARKRYKIEKKVREHNRKMRKEAKHSKSKLMNQFYKYTFLLIYLQLFSIVLFSFREIQDDTSTKSMSF